tara:strand:+ start:114 stop:395 length:282 start_codon:yes stop_codon:yes gene_type:complete
LKIKVLTCFYYDKGWNKKLFKVFKENDLENYLCNLEKSSNFSYINERKISIYKRDIKSLVTVEILNQKEKIYKYISAGRHRKTILNDIVNNRF